MDVKSLFLSNWAIVIHRDFSRKALIGRRKFIENGKIPVDGSPSF